MAGSGSQQPTIQTILFCTRCGRSTVGPKDWCSWCNATTGSTKKQLLIGSTVAGSAPAEVLQISETGFLFIYLGESFEWAILRPNYTVAHQGTKSYIERLWKRDYFC